MKKRLILLLLAVFTTFAFSACKSEPSEAETSPEDESVIEIPVEDGSADEDGPITEIPTDGDADEEEPITEIPIG